MEGEIWNLEEGTVLGRRFRGTGWNYLLFQRLRILFYLVLGFLRQYHQIEYSGIARDCLALAVRKEKLGSADEPPQPQASLGGTLACGSVSQASALSLTPQPGRATWWPLVGGGGWGARSETETVIKSFFTHPHPQQEVILSAQ